MLKTPLRLTEAGFFYTLIYSKKVAAGMHAQSFNEVDVVTLNYGGMGSSSGNLQIKTAEVKIAVIIIFNGNKGSSLRA